MLNKNSSGFAIWEYLSALYFLQMATCFTCFVSLEITLFNTVQNKVVSFNLGRSMALKLGMVLLTTMASRFHI